jgi:hypothetical protein
VFPSAVTQAADSIDVLAAPTHLDVRLSFPAPRFEPGAGGTVPRVGDLEVRADAVGAPVLPVDAVTVVLPAGRRVERLEVLGAPRALGGSYRLAWGQPPVPIGQPPGPPAEADAALYASDALYPAAPVTLAREGLFRGYRLANLLVRPLQVRPASGRVVAWQGLTVRLHLGPERRDEGELPPRGLAADRAALGRVAVNPEEAASYGTAATDARADEPYLIVCPQVLAEEFQRLLDHRAATGMAGRMMTVEEIDAGYTGVDLAEKIRMAIREAYQQRGTTFALLGGDDADGSTELVPYRGCLLDAGGYRYTDAPSDFYFGALDGSWNQDGDDVWCEPDEIDYYSEVHIGRATVDTPAEARRFIDKVLAYEEGLADDRRTDLVWIGESLDSSTWGGDSKDVTAELVPPDEYDLTRLYEREGTFSRSAVIDNLNRGPHLTNHLGHANDGYVMGIYSSDVDALTNETPFFSYSQGCDAGAFDQKFSGSSEAISEHFLTAENAAFGVIMNVRYGWYSSGSTNGPSQPFDHEFYDALFTEGLRTLGEASDDSRHDNAADSQTNAYLRWCFLETNLHGDPATPVQVGLRFKAAGARFVDEDPVHGNVNGAADPHETLRIAVTLENTRSDDAHAVEAFLSSSDPRVIVRDAWAAWGDVPAHEALENAPPHFSATVDVPCGTYVPFTLDVRYAQGDPERVSFTMLVGERAERVLFDDDGETEQGWSSGGTCTDGHWVREAPVGTTNGTAPANPGEDSSADGTRCYVTGNEGVVADDDDVDEGTAVLTSPPLDPAGFLELDISYDRWFHVMPRTTPPINTLLIEVSGDGGANWTELERVTRSETPWVHRSFTLDNLLEPGAQLMLRATANEYPGSARDVVVEAGLDEVVFEGIWAQCEEYAPDAEQPPRPVGDTLLVTRHDDHVRLDWTPSEPGGGHGAAAFYRVERTLEPAGDWTLLGDTIEPRYLDADACLDPDFHQYLVTAWNDAGDEAP